MILQEVFAPVNEVKPLSKDQMEAMDEAREQDDSVTPELQKPAPGFFDGMGEASWKGVASGALKSASALDTVLSSTGMVRAALNNAQVETGYTFDDLEERTAHVENLLDQDSKALRKRARDEYGVDPTTMGTAAQIVYGVAETIPKAIGYSVLAGPAGGSVLFGADLGISRAQELMDEGVDKNTAINAGLVTFGTAALGMRLPATFGRSRIASATIGAAANTGLTAAEMQGVNWVLQNQNYNELAQKYQLNTVDLATSAIFGGVMGGVLWRPGMNPARPQSARERSAVLQQRIERELRAASPDTISDEAIRTQAAVQATGIQVMADRANIDVDSIAPEIVRGDAGATELNQPMTQGREWHMGVSRLRPEDELEVLSYEPSNFSREQSIDSVRDSLSDGVQNQDTGFVLTASLSDIKKSVGARGSEKEKVFNYVAPHIADIAQKAKLLESHADLQHRNDEVQGIHIFGQPVLFGDTLYRVQLIVRDYVIPKQERTAVHSIDGIEIERIENPPPEEAQLEGGSSAIESSASSVKTGEPPAVPDNLKITVSRFLNSGNRPYIRSDGRGFFDPIDDSSYSKGGTYSEGGFNQRAWHGSPYTFDRFSTENIGSGTGRSTYGWGLYFTKDKQVAESYRDTLGGDNRLYEVEVPEDDVLLDSDATFAEQPQKVRDAINKLYADEYDGYWIPDWWDGRQIYQDIILREEGYTDPDDIPGDYEIDMEFGELAGNTRLASEKLNSIGVKGVKFIGDDDDVGFVVFDDRAIQTIDFYQNQANREVLVDIDGNEFSAEIAQAKSGNKAPLIKKAEQFIQTIGVEVSPEDRLSKGRWERAIDNDTIGDIRITTRGAKELRGEAFDYPENLIGLPALEQVLRHGEFEGWQPNRKKEKKPNVKAYGKLSANVRIGGEVRKVSVQIERYNNGKAYYFIETEKPSLARNFSQLGTASVEGSPSDANDTINIEVESIEPTTIEPTTRGSFNPALNRITLTANANISTYSHEMGHWYLENLFQLSRRAVAENTLKEDADILLREFGIKSLDDWDKLGIEGQRKFHEQFASWVEIYLSAGRAPKPTLQRVFERLGQWLVDLYRELGGVKKAVGDTYKAEVGEELPPVSEEVGKVLDRLFANDRAVRKASQVSKSQVAAARMVQANRTNNNKLEEILAMPDGRDKTRALRDLEKSTKAQLKAIEAMRRGLPVDVSKEVEHIDVDTDHLVEMKGNFGRAYVMGNTDSAVVLQNRDRSDMGSIGQMNAIAANPQYGLVSVSRSYSGAPVVSYGSVPDSAHLGNNDFIVESNGNRIPFMYAVVEADDVETSNFIDGSTNTTYGNPQRMNAVVGNGRMTALKEAYNRGTATQYRADLESDTAHGIKTEVIQEMKNPVLVRVINPEDVSTGFISRSNGQQVLALDDVEVAREDAPKIRARAGQYEFDEAGNPTRDTLTLFIQDLHDPNALGRLITADGRPTPEAVRRIRNAVFFEAYQSPELSALFSQEVDPGIRRILNGLANIAPRIIELREQAQQLDFSNLLVEAANRIRQARLNPDEGADFATQMSFLDNPATNAFVEFLDDNANSAAAIARTLNPLIDWAENAAQAADGGLFGGDAEVHVDLADVIGQLRNIINDQRSEAGLEPLPEIDINALRDQIQVTVDTVAQTVDEVNARIEAETAQAETDLANQAEVIDAQRQQSLAVLDEKTSLDARAQFMMEQNPDQIFRVLDENGMEVQGTLNDLLAQADDEVRQAQVEAAGMGRAVECVLRNGGI